MPKDMNIFISYARVDDPDRVLCKQLHSSLIGERVWFDQGMIGARDWWEQVVTEIKKCDIFLYLFSPEWLKSTICQKEIDVAIDERKTLIPVEIVQVSKNSDLIIRIPERVNSFHRIEAYNRDSNGNFTMSTGMRIKEAIDERKFRRIHPAHISVSFDITNWCHVESNEININGNVNKIRDFEIMSNPVTNKQIATFFSNQYRYRSWWHYSERAYEWRLKSQKPKIIKLNEMSAVVSWYDAIAYSKWYSSTQKGIHRLPTLVEMQSALDEQGDCFNFSDAKKEWLGNSIQHLNSYDLSDFPKGIICTSSFKDKLSFEEVEKDYSSEHISFRLMRRN